MISLGRLGRSALAGFGMVAFVALAASGPAFAGRGSLQRFELLETETVAPNQLGMYTLNWSIPSSGWSPKQGQAGCFGPVAPPMSVVSIR
jgi:hypothetical protein